MGCCFSAPYKENTGTDGALVYYYCPRTIETSAPSLSSSHLMPPAVSPGLHYDRNTNLSSSEPSAPMQYDVEVAHSCNPPGNFQSHGMKTDHIPTGSDSVGATNVEHTLGSLKGSECKSGVVGKKDSVELVEKEPTKLSLSYDLKIEEEEEDVCPTCLEEYDFENPKIITKCDHHFHLSCIYEWMERRDTCPICDKIMKFDLGNEEQ